MYLPEQFLSPYAVSLQNWPDLGAPDRIAAEVRYAIELERAFGTPEQVCQAWGDATEAGAWQQAEHSATQADWRGLPVRPAHACFQVCVEGQDGGYTGPRHADGPRAPSTANAA